MPNNNIVISAIKLMLLLVLQVMTNGIVSAEAVPTPTELMEKTDSYFNKYDSFKGTWGVSYGSPDSKVRSLETEWEVLKNGPKVKVIKLGSKTPPFVLPQNANKMSPKTLEKLKEKHERRFERKEFITVPDKNSLHIFSPDRVLGEIHPTEETANRIFGNTPFALYYGYLEFEPIQDLLQSMTLTTKVAELDKSKSYVLCGDSKDGGLHIQLWFDPNFEYVIRKIEYQKKVSRPGMPDSYAKVIYKQSDFQKVDGMTLPMNAILKTNNAPKPKLFREGKKRVTHKDSSGNIIMEPGNETTTFLTMQNYDYDPIFVAADFEPSILIKEGSRVHMQDARQLRYEWKDGKVTPVVSEIPKGNKFINNGMPTKRLFLILAGIALISLAAITHYRRVKHK